MMKKTLVGLACAAMLVMVPSCGKKTTKQVDVKVYNNKKGDKKQVKKSVEVRDVAVKKQDSRAIAKSVVSKKDGNSGSVKRMKSVKSDERRARQPVEVNEEDVD